jgi:hypothetical protein
MRFELKRSHLITVIAIILAAAYITLFFPKQDFSVYYSAGRSLLSGRVDLYAADFANAGVMDYRYPPVFILLFAPFAIFPFAVSVFVWAGLMLTAMVASFRQVAEAARRLLETHRLKLVLTLAALLSVKYLLVALKPQNVHLFLVVAVFASFFLLLKNKLLPASFLMAVVIAVKAFPVLLLPCFAIKRQWQFLGMTAGFVLMFLLVPTFYFGIDRNIDLHQEWFSKVINESDFYELNGPPNLSVPGQTMRYLTTVHYEDRVLDRSYANVNFAEIAPENAKLIGRFAAGLIALITFAILFLIDRKYRDAENKNGMVLYEFAFAICMILLVGPRTNIIYFTAMFIPYVVLLVSFFERRSLLLLIAVIATTLATVVLPLVPGAKAQRLFVVLGVDTIAAFVVWTAMGFLLINSAQQLKDPETALLQMRKPSLPYRKIID